jgi:HNH endonuclease
VKVTLPPSLRSPRPATKAEWLERLRSVAAELGHTPSVSEWVYRHERPPQTTLYGAFGSWDAVVAAAGLPPVVSRARVRPTSRGGIDIDSLARDEEES